MAQEESTSAHRTDGVGITLLHHSQNRQTGGWPQLCTITTKTAPPFAIFEGWARCS